MITEARWYKEGQEAHDAGVPQTDCPYAVRSAKWYIWRAGWLSKE